MKRKNFFIAIAATLILGVLFPGASAQTVKTVVSENAQEIVVRFETNNVDLQQVNTQYGQMQIPFIDQGTFFLKSGFPDLQKLTASVVIPATGSSSIEVISSNFYEINNVDIAPSKGNLTRDINPDNIPFVKAGIYNQNAFWPNSLASVRDPYIIRDLRGQTLVVNPLTYNPVTKTLRVYTEITVRLSFNNSQGTNELKTNNNSPFSWEFARLYESHFLNVTPNNKYTPVEEDGKMLIICHGPFMTSMEPFVRWKNQKGIPTEMVNVSTIGNAAAIKTYVANYYNTHGLTYLLLVGDHAQVPASSTSAGPSDNNYAYIVGGDHYPDIFVGRFSAENVEHVTTQVERTIQYEKFPEIAGTWYKKGAGIASEEGPGHGGLYDHQHMQALRAKLLAYTYNNVSEHYEGTQGGVDLPGHPTAPQVFNDINPGAGIILYTGHGWDQGWGTSGFSNTEVNNLTNVNKLPFIWSVACVNGNFTTTTCFGEAWLRATHSNQPTGAIGVMASTINQSWNPPMSGQLEMVDILVESYATNIKRSFGGISMNGCMKMNDDYGSGGNDMTDTWVCFGDPSVVVRTDQPGAMTVTHPAVTIIGNDNIDVQCNINGALVCLSIDGVILGRGYVVGGNVNIAFSTLTTPDPIDVVVTAYNKQTYIGSINVIPPAGPYVIRETVTINDATGNNNGLADFGENIQFNVTLKNIGIDPANNVTATLSSGSSDVTITGNSANFGNIAAGSSQLLNNAYALTVAPNVTDQSVAMFSIAATNGTDTWNSSFSIVLNAPSLSVPQLSYNDAGGNQNGRPDPGETVQMIFGTLNSGNASSVAATATLSSSSPYVTITNPSINAGVLQHGNTTPVSFEVIIDPTTPIGTVLDFNYVCTAGAYATSRQVQVAAGLIVEDWESNDMESYPWTTSGNAPWTIISGTNVFEGGFAARSGVIGDGQQSILSVTLNVTADDTISFYKKVSCENGSQYGQWWDYLEFHIGTTQKGRWDGEIAWSREAYFVTSGSRTFKWTYVKDYVVSEGEDAAWIDFVVFPPIQTSASVDETLAISHYVTCYPNPASDIMTIELGLASADIMNIEIYDLNGKLVHIAGSSVQMQAGTYSKTIDIRHLQQGTYYLKVNSDKVSMSHTFMVVK